MDEFEKRLKEDAHAVEAKVSPQLERRIEASLHGTAQVVPVPRRRREPAQRIGWASSLTGLAAAVVVIVLVNWNRSDVVAVPDDTLAERTVPEYVEQLHQRFPLDARTAEFEAPLEEELERLKADFEKARKTVREDIEFAF